MTPDATRARRGGGEQGERARELAGEVVHTEVGTVDPELLRGHGEFDRLEQGVGPGVRLARVVGVPVAEAQEADPFAVHAWSNACWRMDIPGPSRSDERDDSRAATARCGTGGV